MSFDLTSTCVLSVRVYLLYSSKFFISGNFCFSNFIFGYYVMYVNKVETKEM